MHENSIHLQDPDVPLCVDLDGTLIRSDVLWESMLLLLRANPLYLFVLPFWFLRGRAHLKQEIANRTHLNPENLPYHLPFMEFLREERKSRRLIILATASDRLIAEAVAKHVGLFDGVLASEGTTNMRGSNKSNELIKRYGRNRFDYAGNSSVDLGVWKDCRHAIVVNADDSLVEKAGKISKVSKVFNEHKSQLRLILKSLRPHQWVKNLLIFVPLVFKPFQSRTGVPFFQPLCIRCLRVERSFGLGIRPSPRQEKKPTLCFRSTGSAGGVGHGSRPSCGQLCLGLVVAPELYLRAGMLLCHDHRLFTSLETTGFGGRFLSGRTLYHAFDCRPYSGDDCLLFLALDIFPLYFSQPRPGKALHGVESSTQGK